MFGSKYFINMPLIYLTYCQYFHGNLSLLQMGMHTAPLEGLRAAPLEGCTQLPYIGLHTVCVSKGAACLTGAVMGVEGMDVELMATPYTSKAKYLDQLQGKWGKWPFQLQCVTYWMSYNIILVTVLNTTPNTQLWNATEQPKRGSLSNPLENQLALGWIWAGNLKPLHVYINTSHLIITSHTSLQTSSSTHHHATRDL